MDTFHFTVTVIILPVTPILRRTRQGLLRSEPHVVEEAEKFVCFWLHEASRVYSDRLADTKDVGRFEALLQVRHACAERLYSKNTCIIWRHATRAWGL